MKAQYKIGTLIEFVGGQFALVKGIAQYNTHVAYIVDTDQGDTQVKESEVKSAYVIVDKVKNKSKAKTPKEKKPRAKKAAAEVLTPAQEGQTDFETEADPFADA